jgi:uncharacterized protein with GYD domain
MAQWDISLQKYVDRRHEQIYIGAFLRFPTISHLGGESMSSYLIQVSYTTEAVKKLIAKPEHRHAVIQKAVEELGGKLIGSWLSFGDYDVVVVAELPNNAAAAGLALAIAAGGSCKTVKTTPLLSVEEGKAAMKNAGASHYKPVGATK